MSNWQGYRSRLRLATKTDADGKFRLNDAPSDGALYDFLKQGYIAVQDFPMSPEGKGQSGKDGYRITMKPPLRVAGTIVDAQTQKPLEKCTLIRGIDFDDGRAPSWQRLFETKTITDGRYEVEFAQNIWGFRIRVEAEGYRPAVSRLFKPGNVDTGRETYDFKLSKAAPLTGTVLGADGQPLEGADVFLATQIFTVKDRKAPSESQRNARKVHTDASGHFELPPEVEPFYLIVLHDQGHAVKNEAELASASTIRIQPWTAKNGSFQAERRPVSHSAKATTDNERKILVRVVDEEGKPVEGAHVGTFSSFHARPDYYAPPESDWSYSPNIVSGRDGTARLSDNYINCVVARHVERELAAVQSVSPEQAKSSGTITLTMQPQCKVFGKLTAKELETRNRKISWSNVYVYLDNGMGRPMSCGSNNADFHFFLPPGTYTLDAYATDTQHVRQSVTVKPGQQELEVGPIDLPPTGLVLLEGKPAPELREIMAWKNGGPIKLSDLRGKVVILAITAGWSGERMGSIMPNLFPMYDKYHDQGLTIVEIRIDWAVGNESEAQRNEKLAAVKKPFWQDHDLPIPIGLVQINRVLLQQAAKAKNVLPKVPCPVLQDYGIIGMPTGVLIDRQGRVVGRFDPRGESDDAILEKVFKEK